jgi:hypothetical protein
MQIRRILAMAAMPLFAATAVFSSTAFTSAHADTVPVHTGDTLSGIAASRGVSLSELEAANPQLGNPNLIYTGQAVNVPGGTSSAPSTPAPSTSGTPVPSTSAPVTTPGGGVSIPGMPQGLANCIAFRESTNGTNPAANGNVFGIIPASGYNVAGQSLAQQEATAGQIYAQYGGAAWAADGCPGT